MTLRPRIFLGSSREETRLMRVIARRLEESGCDPIAWDSQVAFPPGSFTWESLEELARSVDAAVFLFAEGDKVWYRGDERLQPRDNVLLEYGLFAGVLGRRKVVIARVGVATTPVDLAGITFAQLAPDRLETGMASIQAWAESIRAPTWAPGRPPESSVGAPAPMTETIGEEQPRHGATPVWLVSETQSDLILRNALDGPVSRLTVVGVHLNSRFKLLTKAAQRRRSIDLLLVDSDVIADEHGKAGRNRTLEQLRREPDDQQQLLTVHYYKYLPSLRAVVL